MAMTSNVKQWSWNTMITKSVYLVFLREHILLKKRTSDKYKEHFHITDVPNRDFILIHNCNYSRQLLGCIGVGASFVDLDSDGLKDITDSKKTLAKLYEIMPNEFQLVIK